MTTESRRSILWSFRVCMKRSSSNWEFYNPKACPSCEHDCKMSRTLLWKTVKRSLNVDSLMIRGILCALVINRTCVGLQITANVKNFPYRLTKKKLVQPVIQERFGRNDLSESSMFAQLGNSTIDVTTQYAHTRRPNKDSSCCQSETRIH